MLGHFQNVYMNASPNSGLFLGITYTYGTVAAINVSTVTVSSGSTLNIGAYNSIIVNSSTKNSFLFFCFFKI
jgi:hypothetical protein